METTKLSPRDKIDVDLVGKKFKQIQKTMKNISDVKEKAVQKPIVPAVGVNSKIKAFEKSTNGLDSEKKMIKTAYVANRSVKGITTEKKGVKTQAEKISANKDKVHDSKETLNKPPLAQNLLNKVILETPKMTSEAVRPVKGPNVAIKVDSVKQGTAKQWDVPLVQKLLHDVLKDVKEEVQKKEENLKVQGKVNVNKESTTVKSDSQNMEKNDEVFKRKLPVSNQIRKDETDIASSLSEDGLENCPKSERSSDSISIQPQTVNDKESDEPISTDDGTSLSLSVVRDENMTAIHKEPQSLADPLVQVTSREKVDTTVIKECSTSTISEISTIINSESKGNRWSATPATTTSDVQVAKLTSSASNQLTLHETKGQTSSVKVGSSVEAMGVPEKSPQDAHVSGTASMARKLEGKPSHHKDQSVDDSEKVEESHKIPDSPSEAKVASVFHSTPGDQVKKEPQKMSEPNSKVTKLASAINADPDTFRTKKKTKEETKCKNTGSVLSMIKKIQKNANKKKEKAQPTGKVKISPKFDVNGNGKEDHVFTFKHTDESVPGKTEKDDCEFQKGTTK